MPHLKPIRPGSAPRRRRLPRRDRHRVAAGRRLELLGGPAEIDLPVPNAPALVGVAVHFQALQAGSFGLALTNLASTTIE